MKTSNDQNNLQETSLHSRTAFISIREKLRNLPSQKELFILSEILRPKYFSNFSE